MGESLKQLETIINNAGNQRPRCPWHTDADHFGIALQVLPEVTGDFYQTLKDCETLLRDHARLQNGRANFIDNMAWWSSAERNVTALRERVKFHITKVALIAKPFEMQLLLGIRRELQHLRRDVAHLTGIVSNGLDQFRDASNPSYLQPIVIPDDLTAKFSNALDTNRPSSLKTLPDWPLKEGFDALVFHFAKSTVEFNSRPELGQNIPDGSQYLNLLKSVWIMEQLKNSSYFQSAGSDSLWADYMRELEDDIRGQFRRFDAGQLVRPPHDVILQMPDSYYSIWVDEGPLLRPLDMAEQRPKEEKVLELALPLSFDTRHSSLTVFRKSDVAFRLVTTTKQTDNPLFHSEEGHLLDMNSTRLVPAYAAPDNTSATNHKLVLCNEKGQYPEWHSLKDSTDVASLQRALTGYRVHHDMPIFQWCINGSLEPGDSGRGRLQLWQFKPLPRIPLDSEPQKADWSLSIPKPRSQLGCPTLSSPTSATLSELEAAHVDPVRSMVNGFSRLTTQVDVKSPQTQRCLTGLSNAPTQAKSGSSNLKKYSTGKSSPTLVSRSSVVSPVNGPRGDGTELVRPEVPVLIIFTMCKDRYTFLHIKRELGNLLPHLLCYFITHKKPVEQNVFVNRQSCDCKNSKKSCKRAVLESKQKHFLVQKFSAEQGLFSWDLAKFRCPRRQDFKDVKVVEKMNYLVLDFSTEAGKPQVQEIMG